jgi:hypothetical protein
VKAMTSKEAKSKSSLRTNLKQLRKGGGDSGGDNLTEPNATTTSDETSPTGEAPPATATTARLSLSNRMKSFESATSLTHAAHGGYGDGGDEGSLPKISHAGGAIDQSQAGGAQGIVEDSSKHNAKRGSLKE